MATKMYLPPKGESRRGFVKKGFFGGLLLALGGGAFVALREGKLEPLPEGGLKMLSAREYAVVVAAARRLLPQTPPWPTPDTLRVAGRIDGVVFPLLDETARLELRQLLAVLENGLSGLLLVGRPTPFTLMPPEAQDEILAGWQHSRLLLRRSGYTALRALIVGAYFANPAAWPSMGYPGPPIAFHDPNARPWRGGAEPRPPGLGVWVEPAVADGEPK